MLQNIHIPLGVISRCYRPNAIRLGSTSETPKASETQGQVLQMSRYSSGESPNLWLWRLFFLSVSQMIRTQGVTHPL